MIRAAARMLSVHGAWIALAIVSSVTARADTLSFQDLLSRPRAAATARIAYGPAPHQFGELWLPAGKGPHPVVVMIHGGCWLASLPGVELMAYAADDLRQRGLAVWNVDYRRIGETGGGYPGTFEDIASAVDALRTLGKTYALDLRNVVAVGHSAGGHLAMWAAARPRLAASSRLRGEHPLPVKAVVSLAGILDLAAYRDRGPAACGGPRVIEMLVGAAARDPRVMFADTSPREMLPAGVPQTIISGALDPIVPAIFGRDYAVAASAAGDRVKEITIEGAGHFELIDPQSNAFESIRSAILGFSR